MIGNLREKRRSRKRDPNSSCTGETDNDSSSSNESSTYIRNNGLMNPYSPHLELHDQELLCAQAK